MTMVKTDAEIQKVVKAMAFLTTYAVFQAYAVKEGDKSFMEGVTVKVTLNPGQADTADSLITIEAKSPPATDGWIPPQGILTQTVKDFVMATRKVFTSIHEFKKNLSADCTKVPDEHDMEWARSVLKSYEVTPTKEYILYVPLKEEGTEALVEMGVGENRAEAIGLFKRSGWFIPKLEGIEDLASPEEDRDKLRHGIEFREI